MFCVNINGHTIKSNGTINVQPYCWLANIPVVTPSENKRNISDVYMFDGGMADKNYYKGTAQITLTFHSKGYVDQMIGFVSSALISEALRITQYYSDESRRSYITVYQDGQNPATQGYSYIILNATISDIQRMSGDYGRVSVTYDIEPFRYYGNLNAYVDVPSNGTAVISTDQSYGITGAKPLFHVTATGAGTFSVEGREFAILQAGTYDINSKLKVTKQNGVLADSKVAGSYEDLWLYDDANTVATTAGISMRVYPRIGVPI